MLSRPSRRETLKVLCFGPLYRQVVSPPTDLREDVPRAVGAVGPDYRRAQDGLDCRLHPDRSQRNDCKLGPGTHTAGDLIWFAPSFRYTIH